LAVWYCLTAASTVSPIRYRFPGSGQAGVL